MAETAGYRISRSLARILADLFYRRVEVAGLERVPLSGPLIVAASHHQGLMDGILAHLPERRRATTAKFQELLRQVPEPVLEKSAR